MTESLLFVFLALTVSSWLQESFTTERCSTTTIQNSTLKTLITTMDDDDDDDGSDRRLKTAVTDMQSTVSSFGASITPAVAKMKDKIKILLIDRPGCERQDY